MARMLALCSLPRTNPGRRKEYVRRNGPYTLVMSAGGLNKLPYGNLPRLLMAWVSTETVRTRRRELILGRSLSEFMRAVGIFDDGGAMRRRLRTQMDRLFHAVVSLTYEDKHGKQSASSLVADRVEFWWDPKRPRETVLWDSKIRLGEDFFNEIIRHPIPLDMNILKSLKRSPLGLDLYMWLSYRTFTLKKTAPAPLERPLPPVRGAPLEDGRLEGRGQLPDEGPTGVQEDQGGVARSELHNCPRRADPRPLSPRDPSRRAIGHARLPQDRRLFHVQTGRVHTGQTGRVLPESTGQTGRVLLRHVVKSKSLITSNRREGAVEPTRGGIRNRSPERRTGRPGPDRSRGVYSKVPGRRNLEGGAADGVQ